MFPVVFVFLSVVQWVWLSICSHRLHLSLRKLLEHFVVGWKPFLSCVSLLAGTLLIRFVGNLPVPLWVRFGFWGTNWVGPTSFFLGFLPVRRSVLWGCRNWWGLWVYKVSVWARWWHFSVRLVGYLWSSRVCYRSLSIFIAFGLRLWMDCGKMLCGPAVCSLWCCELLLSVLLLRN
jgi:hypothetical protein